MKRQLHRIDHFGRRVRAPWWARILHALGIIKASR
ncbi:hypothetical protein GGR88_001366 [Sphingomonas jejuensis]|uniref:Uncharacterized protein n=1 Tax=Sphingomonas jejuensis TaxID=904715 RepID=A0ABX0XM00_9SPHN|nr:hypothetical protein [Sphingomonas jejuensis]